MGVRGSGVIGIICLAAVLTADLAAAETIYLDRISFAPGTDLTNLTYTPDIGGVDATTFGAFGAAGATVTAALFGGSVAARVDLPAGTGDDYLGRFFTTFTDRVLDVQWELTTTAVASGIGGFFIRFPTAAGIPDGMQLLAGFLNDGRIIAFNNLPVLMDADQIGTYDVGTTYAVRVLYDLPADRYSFFLNGVLLADRPIPIHLHADEVYQFGFDVSQVLAPAGASQHFFDDVRVDVVPEPATMMLVASGVGIWALRQRRARQRRAR
jgi:hypothetical protein